MKRTTTIPLLHSVRTRLLVMLAVLSLPLLIISLTQLNTYRQSLHEQSETIARIETTAASSALHSWLETHPEAARPQHATLSLAQSEDLYRRLQQNASPDAGTIIAVFDSSGRLVTSTTSSAPAINLSELSTDAKRLKWADGMERTTSLRRVEPYGWTVVVGVPLMENTLAGRSILKLTATWFVALLASILLGIWAVGRFTKPLRKLAASALTLGSGNLQERVAVETEDEVGALAEGFNVMARHVQTKFNELQTQSAFIEEVMDGLPLGVLVLDKSLIVRKANTAFARAIGREAEALTGRGLYEAAAGLAGLSDVVEDVRRSRKPFVTYGLPLNLVARAREQADKSVDQNYWDITICPTTERSAGRGDLILILSEVSKRVRAEKLATAAFASERARAAELEGVINQMNEGVVIVDRHGRYKVNPAAAEIMGRQRNEFRDGAEALIEDFVLRNPEGQELPPTKTPLYRALRARETISGEQLRIVRPDGEIRVIAISATPVTGENGEQEGAVAVFRDITEGVEQHDELVAAYDRLREHDRLKSAFVSNVTHELRTPLNVIIGLCQLLQRDAQLPLAPLQNEAVFRMERNARSLLELVNDLLDYSRLEAGRAALHLEKLDMAKVVKEIVEDYDAEIKDKHIELRTEISTELGEVVTDRHKLSQVLSNLVGNAVKFTTGGTVVIACAPVDAERWSLEVSDTGIGMSRDALSFIFDEFRQVDDRLARAYGGTGLGLAITRKIVELMEGEITVESKPKEGSCFRIVWPRTVRQRTGTGSLVEKDVPAPSEPKSLRSRAF